MSRKRERNQDNISKIWLWLGMAFGIISSLFLWVLFRWQKKIISSNRLDAKEINIITLPPSLAETTFEKVEHDLTEPDDLTKIEGIGPKISQVLQNHEIRTFRQLSECSPEHLKSILDTERIPLADPTTWPDQATFASLNDWDGLNSFQSQLKGGRR